MTELETMNQTAILFGTTYRLLEIIPGLDSASYILCEDGAERHFVCPQELWEASAPVPTTRVHANSPALEKIALFLERFHGRDDVYARRWYNYKTQKSGYAPACRNEWVRGICDKKNTAVQTAPTASIFL